MYTTLYNKQYIEHILHSLGAFVHNLIKEMHHSMFVVLIIVDLYMIVKCKAIWVNIGTTESTPSVGLAWV